MSQIKVETLPHNDLVGLELLEDEHIIVLRWKSDTDEFDLIYKKEKDLVLVMKNEKMAKLDALSDLETGRYKEALTIAINYHHERCLTEIQ